MKQAQCKTCGRAIRLGQQYRNKCCITVETLLQRSEIQTDCPFGGLRDCIRCYDKKRPTFYECRR